MTVTMDSPKLRDLTRSQLQSLAKREFVRAVGKTEDIIRRLVRKHPRGVPIPEEADNPSASSAPPKQNVLRKSRKGTPSLSAVPGSSGDGATDPKGKGKSVAEETFPSPSSSTEALELLYPEDEPAAGPSNTNVAPIREANRPEVVPDTTKRPSHQAHNEGEGKQNGAAPPEAPNPDWEADEESETDEVYEGYDYPTGAPNHYMVVDALRQFTTLVDTIPAMETRVAESRCLIQRTETLLEKAMPDVRELTVTREYLETFLLGKMKQKRELWDGTARMPKADRKLRMEWLRAQRKAENEKRWKETNELYAKHGHAPEPFSAFASQSDEEVIESLQTTPASSNGRSPKRTREESIDGESDGDFDNDSRGQRKRACI